MGERGPDVRMDLETGEESPEPRVDRAGSTEMSTVHNIEDTIWQVGCYQINPTTPRGQKFFILHMLVLPLIPITALVIQNSVNMNTLLGYQNRVSTIRRQVRGAMEIALFIQNIQEERAEVALYIFTNQSDSNMTEVKYNENRFVINSSHNNALQCRFSVWIIWFVWSGNILEQ